MTRRGNTYAETTSLCPTCAADCPAWYEERADGMYLHVDCPRHGICSEQVERDNAFFKQGYEQEYLPEVRHLVLPVTYRCNLRCHHCYAMSNCPADLPPDRPIEAIVAVARRFDGNVTLIGGEPTVRDDIFDLISAVRQALPNRKISLATNGQKLHAPDFLEALRAAGLDFVFLSLNDPEYEERAVVYANKLKALHNCHEAGIPVWLQRTLTKAAQIDSMVPLLETYRKTVFFVTVRSVRPFGVNRPGGHVFVSDMLRHLGATDRHSKGVSPFNRMVRLGGRRAKLTSWVNDAARVDPIDSAYYISNDTLTTFHRGMKVDELLLASRRRDRAACETEPARAAAPA